MARPKLENIRSVGDFATLFRWDVEFTVAPAAVPNFGTLVSNMNYLCETSTIPKATNNTFETNIRGHKVISNGIMTYDNNLTLTFVETVNKDIRNVLKAWRDAIWKTGDGTAADETSKLKGTLTLRLLNNKDEPTWTINIHGVLLQDYDIGQLDGASSDALRPTMTLTYDYFEEV